MSWFSTADVDLIVSNQVKLGEMMTALQNAIAQLQTNVQALTAAVTASQQQQFSPADVSNVQAIGDQVTKLAASLTPAPAPTPTPTPAS